MSKNDESAGVFFIIFYYVKAEEVFVFKTWYNRQYDDLPCSAF